MAVRRPPPAERVRARLRAVAGDHLSEEMPGGYQRLGRVLLVRLPPALHRYRAQVGEAWQRELGVATVLARTGPVSGELRRPTVEVIAGTTTETEVVEHGARWRFDAARLMFAAGNRTERRRIALLVRPGESVADLFAGIGYFAIPVARACPTARVTAVEKNPVAFRYLEENATLNGVATRLTAVLGDNRTVALPLRHFDRIVLGYLPSSLPWLGRALELLQDEGGSLHVHLVADARAAKASAAHEVERALEHAGAELLAPPVAREVKPYGPGRTHVVVDVRVRSRRTSGGEGPPRPAVGAESPSR